MLTVRIGLTCMHNQCWVVLGLPLTAVSLGVLHGSLLPCSVSPCECALCSARDKIVHVSPPRTLWPISGRSVYTRAYVCYQAAVVAGDADGDATHAAV